MILRIACVKARKDPRLRSYLVLKLDRLVFHSASPKSPPLDRTSGRRSREWRRRKGASEIRRI